MIFDNKTIVACATGEQSHAAIAIIRLSGINYLPVIRDFFSSPKFTPHHMIKSNLIVGGELWDDLCYCYFPAPKSYTGEDVLELYVHGNRLNVQRCLRHFGTLPGFRFAQPGEFTRRAVANKKMTLVQAEGLDLMLNASTPLALSQGLSLLHGELHHHYLELYELYKSHKAHLELLLDFHEDVGQEAALNHLHQSFNLLSQKISFLQSRLNVDSSSLLRPEVVLAGEPNAGKSTLFNLLLGEDRAIVTPIAGTTRDYLTEDFSYADVIYRLVDTAGFRSSTDIIEQAGILKGIKKFRGAFFKILLINPFASDPNVLRQFLSEDLDLIVLTHGDLLGFDSALSDLESKLGMVLSGHPCLDLNNNKCIDVVLSSVNKKYLSIISNEPLLISRHRHVISRCYEACLAYANIVQNESDIGVLSHELNALGHCLHELLGIVSADEILDHVFANFCIGK
jgi:tRNA modification GTPase